MIAQLELMIHMIGSIFKHNIEYRKMMKMVANNIYLIIHNLMWGISGFLLFNISSVLAVGEDSGVTFEDSSNSEGLSSPTSVLLNFDLPSNTHLLMIFFAVMLAIVLGIIFYRALLKSQVTKGIHPREFFATITFMVFGFFLLALFFILINSGISSLGWFTILAGLYLFFLIVFMAMGKIRKWILVILVLIIAIVGFQLTNMNIF